MVLLQGFKNALIVFKGSLSKAKDLRDLQLNEGVLQYVGDILIASKLRNFRLKYNKISRI